MNELVMTATASATANASTADQLADGKFFDFEKERVQPLTLAQLERTHKENDIHGNPLRGIYHYELLNQLLRTAEGAGYVPEVWDLFAAQNRDRNAPGVVRLPQVEATYGERAVEAHVLRRVFANIRLHGNDEGGHTTNLAVAFHQQGIQVGFGNAVVVCHNQCMLGRGHYASTYGARGEKGLAVPELLTTVEGWLMNGEQTVREERERIHRMEEFEMDARTMYMLIGMLTAVRVKADTANKEIRDASAVYPLNQAQITRLTEDMMVRYKRNQRISVWDVYDAATNLYKPSGMDIPKILPQNLAMVDFLHQQFGL